MFLIEKKYCLIIKKNSQWYIFEVALDINLNMNKKKIFNSYGSEPPTKHCAYWDFQKLCKISILVYLQPSKCNKTQGYFMKFTFTCERTFIKVYKSRESFL